MKKTALEGISYWSCFQPDRSIDFNGFFWKRDSGNVLIDPMEMNGDQVSGVKAAGGAQWILLTNYDHLRAAPELKRRFNATVLAPVQERDRFGDSIDVVDEWFSTTRDLPRELLADITVHSIRGGKSEFEAAFFLGGPKALVFGDAVRCHASGELRLLPEAKIADREALLRSLEALRVFPAVRGILLGDGDCFFHRGKEMFEEFLDSLAADKD